MKIKFIIAVGDYKKGATLELPKKKAEQFIGAGFAEAVAKPTRKPAAKK